MKAKIFFCAALMIVVGLLPGCDRRSSTTRIRDTASFSADLTIIRDLSTGYNSADILFERDNEPFSDAIITIGNDTVPNAGGGIYYINDPQFSLPAGINEISFRSPEDNYLKTMTINIPGDFEIEVVSPRLNNSAVDVYISWSASSGTVAYLLVVATEDYGLDGTTPFFATIAAPNTSYTVPDTTFENSVGEIVDGIYFVYIVAYNEGLGLFIREGPDIPMPDDLPVRFITDPDGFLRYGTVAPIDSIIVTPIVAF